MLLNDFMMTAQWFKFADGTAHHGYSIGKRSNMDIAKVSLNHLEAFREYTKECIQDGLDLYDGAKHDSDAYLQKRMAYAEGRELPDGWPPISMYFYIESGKILGAIRIRHGSNDYINNVIGHIGYETSPNARGKGVATAMLQWVVRNVIEQNIVITCDVDNIASRKVIEKCGGEYLGNYYCEEEKRDIMRFQIQRI